MTNRHTSLSEKLTTSALNQRVKDLEAEVAELKTKLDQLRKAKSTTIVKRKREVIYVGGEVKQRTNETTKSPSTDPAQCPSPGEADFSEKYQDGTATGTESEVVVPAAGSSEEKQPTKKLDGDTLHKEQEDNIRRLFQKISELNDGNIALTIENKELACKVAQLTSELSVNEAKYCEREEKIKAEVSSEWRKKYDAWMEEMERKVAEINQKRQ